MTTYDWQQKSEYTTTIFGRVALFTDPAKGMWIFRLSKGQDIGPMFSSFDMALRYAAKKGWAIHPLQ